MSAVAGSGSPAVTGDPRADADALARYAAAADAHLAAMPAKPDRSAAQHAAVVRIQHHCRRARTAFLAAHADYVYDQAVAAVPARFRLGELALAVAELFPGLAPTAARLAAERGLPQEHKEGLEIDQGILFGALLARPDTGGRLVEAMLRPTNAAHRAFAEFRATGRVATTTVTVQRRGHEAHLTVHNGGSLNAEDDTLVADMETAVDLALLDPDVRVCVLRGGQMTHPRYRGRRVFSAGINLKELHRGRISFVDFLLGRELGYVNKIYRGIRIDARDTALTGAAAADVVEKPWLAVVDSFAIGGGAQLLLVCDRVLAAADTYVSLPANHEGIVPGLANLRLNRQAGGRISRQMILAGRRLSARDLDARAILDVVADAADLDAAVAAEAARLDNPAVAVNRRMLRLAEEPVDLFRAYLAEFAVVQARCMYSPDVIARTAAFTCGR